MNNENSNVRKVSIECKKCGTKVEDELDSWPSPDLSAETVSQSRDCIGGTLVCPKCGNKIDYSISVDFNGDIICIPSDLIIS